MSEMAKRLARPLARTSERKGEDHPGPVLPPGAVVELSMPHTVGSAGDAFVSRLRDMVDSLASDLKVSAPQEVTAVVGPGPLGRVSVNGLPATTFDPSPLEAGPERAPEVAGGVVRGLLGRLPLLIGPGAYLTNEAYVVDLGLAVSPLHRPRAWSGAAAEDLVNRAHVEVTRIRITSATLRRFGPHAREAIQAARQAAYLQSGAALPAVTLEVTDLPEGAMQLNLNHVRLPLQMLGPHSSWEDVVDVFAGLTKYRRHWFLRPDHISRRIEREVRWAYPALVEIAESSFDSATLTAVFRELLRSGATIRNLPRLLWLLLEQEPSRAGADSLRLTESPLVPRGRSEDDATKVERDPAVLAARIRKLAVEEAWRLGSYLPPSTPRRLPFDLELELTDRDPDGVRAEVEWAVVDALIAAPETRTIVTRHMESIARVRAVLQALPVPPRVISSHELPPDYDLAGIPTVKAGAERRRA